MEGGEGGSTSVSFAQGPMGQGGQAGTNTTNTTNTISTGNNSIPSSVVQLGQQQQQGQQQGGQQQEGRVVHVVGEARVSPEQMEHLETCMDGISRQLADVAAYLKQNTAITQAVLRQQQEQQNMLQDMHHNRSPQHSPSAAPQQQQQQYQQYQQHQQQHHHHTMGGAMGGTMGGVLGGLEGPAGGTEWGTALRHPYSSLPRGQGSPVNHNLARPMSAMARLSPAHEDVHAAVGEARRVTGQISELLGMREVYVDEKRRERRERRGKGQRED